MKLSEARDERDRQIELVQSGHDPVLQKQVQKRAAVAAIIAEQDSTFKTVALDWYRIESASWRESYAADVLSRLEAHLFPKLGRLTLQEITPKAIADTLKEIQSTGALEVAHRCKRYVRLICAYAVETGLITSSPARDIVRGGLRRLEENKPRPAIIEPLAFGELLNAVDGYEGRDVLRLALQILALTVPRPGELRLARWDNVNLDKATWIIPVSDAKQKREHKIMLSKQAVALFRELKAITGESALCFPLNEANDHKPISENALTYALNAIGYPGKVHCPHGFRASFRSIMARHWPNREILEKCLAHRNANDVERRYDRQEHWGERRKAMQKWADECETLKRRAALLG
jgi:integrase